MLACGAGAPGTLKMDMVTLTCRVTFDHLLVMIQPRDGRNGIMRVWESRPLWSRRSQVVAAQAVSFSFRGDLAFIEIEWSHRMTTEMAQSDAM